jgi:outer membrane lipoprotein SlyB
MHRSQLRKASLALALVFAAGSLTSCAKITEDPVNCGVIGSVVGGVAGGLLGAAFGSSGNVTGGAILGTTLGAGIGAFSGYKICKYPTVESAVERDRKRRLSTSPGAKDDDE